MAIASPRLERNRHGIFVLRLVVPLAHRQPGDAREICMSLRTRDPAYAKVLALRLNALIEQLRLERPDVDPRVVLLEHEAFAVDATKSKPFSYSRRSAKPHPRDHTFAALAGQRRGGESFGGESFGGEIFDSDSPAGERAGFAGEMCESELSGREASVHEGDGEAPGACASEAFAGGASANEVFARVAPRATSTSPTDSYDGEPSPPKHLRLPKLTRAIEAFLRSRSSLTGNRRTTVTEKRTSLSLLARFIGGHGFCAEPPPSTMLSRQMLLAFISSYASRCGKSGSALSSVTVLKVVGHLGEFTEYLVATGLLPASPMDAAFNSAVRGVRTRAAQVKGRRGYRPFTDQHRCSSSSPKGTCGITARRTISGSRCSDCSLVPAWASSSRSYPATFAAIQSVACWSCACRAKTRTPGAWFPFHRP